MSNIFKLSKLGDLSGTKNVPEEYGEKSVHEGNSRSFRHENSSVLMNFVA